MTGVKICRQRNDWARFSNYALPEKYLVWS